MDNHLSYLYSVVLPLNRAYFINSCLVKTTTVDLRDPVVLKYYLDSGFLYIRRLHYNYNHILRSPTDGCNVEITKHMECGSIPLNSPKARKLIRRICYF
jgi:hypothetical protein